MRGYLVSGPQLRYRPRIGAEFIININASPYNNGKAGTRFKMLFQPAPLTTAWSLLISIR